MNIKKQFAKYVSLNILAMVGLSCYILADSYFIAKSQGADGLTALNLVLPVYNIIFAIGAMIGVGSAIRYTISKMKNSDDADKFLFNSVFFAVIIGLIFVIAGNVFPGQILTLLGADSAILSTGTSYTRIFMSFSPFFMLNYIVNAYVRNDGAPNTAMAATLISSIFNILFDYILMFPLGMGMKGAALATGFSPIVGISICLTHLLSGKSKVKMKLCKPSLKRLFNSCQTGVAAFVSEISSGIITMTFNFLILKLAGNTGVAAYGIVANIALVAVAFSNGIAQGSQPLISRSFGNKNTDEVISLRNMSFAVAFAVNLLIYIILAVSADFITELFNSEGNTLLAEYSVTGIRIYFIGILFSGLNIVGSSFFSAIESVRNAFIISILRGLIMILIFAFLLSALLGMNGVWLSYAAAELVTSAVMLYFIHSDKR